MKKKAMLLIIIVALLFSVPAVALADGARIYGEFSVSGSSSKYTASLDKYPDDLYLEDNNEYCTLIMPQ